VSEGTARGGWFARLKAGLTRSSTGLTERITAVVAKRRLDQEALDELEEALIGADLGVETAGTLVKELGRDRYGREVTDIEIKEALAGLIAKELEPYAEPLAHREWARPQVVLVCGVNGTGKTTTIGKLAWHLRKELGRSVVIGAADTFRAAAVEQLERWGERAGVDVVKGPEGSDPGAVAFDAIARGRERGADVIIIDTAGRLHTQHNLMEELTKIRRVITKQMPDAPHETLMTLDATTGQNGVRQAKLFGEAVDVTGIILTKLDGTAKGGIALAVANELDIPVKLIGIGEQLEDLRPFDADDFAKALLT
jgi:fused signal recognition particle receptor